jgi:hypothetical protein
MPNTSPNPPTRTTDAITTRPHQDNPQRSLRVNMPQNFDEEWSNDMLQSTAVEIRAALYYAAVAGGRPAARHFYWLAAKERKGRENCLSANFTNWRKWMLQSGARGARQNTRGRVCSPDLFPLSQFPLSAFAIQLCFSA